MKRAARKKIGKVKREGKAEAFISELAKRGELNPKHRRDFDGLLDAAIPPAIQKK